MTIQAEATVAFEQPGGIEQAAERSDEGIEPKSEGMGWRVQARLSWYMLGVEATVARARRPMYMAEA